MLLCLFLLSYFLCIYNECFVTGRSWNLGEVLPAAYMVHQCLWYWRVLHSASQIRNSNIELQAWILQGGRLLVLPGNRLLYSLQLQQLALALSCMQKIQCLIQGQEPAMAGSLQFLSGDDARRSTITMSIMG